MSSSKAVLSAFLASVICVIVFAAVELGTGDVQGAGSCSLETHVWRCNECVGSCTGSGVCTSTRTSSCFMQWTEPDACGCITVWSPTPSRPEDTSARAICRDKCRSERASSFADAHEDRTPTSRCNKDFVACVLNGIGVDIKRY